MAEDIFDRLNAKDGFHIVQLDDGGSLSLHCQAYGGGELYNLVDTANPESATVTIRQWMGPSDAERGECTRLRFVLDAVARYLTTGGTWEELGETLKTMSRVAINGLAFTGYSYSDESDCYIDEDAGLTYQHVFIKDGEFDDNGEQVARLWEEPTYGARGGLIGGYIEPKTLEGIRKEKSREPDPEPGAPGAADEEDDFQVRNPVSLLGIEDLPPEEDAGGSPGRVRRRNPDG